MVVVAEVVILSAQNQQQIVGSQLPMYKHIISLQLALMQSLVYTYLQKEFELNGTLGIIIELDTIFCGSILEKPRNFMEVFRILQELIDENALFHVCPASLQAAEFVHLERAIAMHLLVSMISKVFYVCMYVCI